MKVYLDNSATTRVSSEAAEAAFDAMRESFGNPSSLHSKGLEAEKLLNKNRKYVASCFSCSSDEIFFTSGGTESDNMAIRGAYRARKRESNRIITSTIEHPAVLETVKELEEAGAEVVRIPVDENSILDLDMLKFEAEKGAAVISIMAVNNETGALMPICRVEEMKGRALLHCDAVQALGKEDIRSLPGDLISVSGHKVHGPKGIGALYIRKGTNIGPLLRGGGQERGLRSGTENTPGIAGFGEACRAVSESLDEDRKVMISLRDRLMEGILSEVKDIFVNSPREGTPSILNISFLGTRGEVILHSLEQKGIFVSTGSACSSKKKGGSHVLKAMGLSEERIEGAIRFSLSRYNTVQEMDYTVEMVKEAVEGFRKLGRFR